MDRRHIMPQPGCDKVVTICEVCLDFKPCLDFKVPRKLESTLPSILCEECLDNFDLEVSELYSKKRRQLLTNLLLKSGWDMNKVMSISREIATLTTDSLSYICAAVVSALNKMTEEFPVPFEVDNTPEPEDRMIVRMKQANLAISLFLLQDELKSRTEKSNE